MRQWVIPSLRSHYPDALFPNPRPSPFAFPRRAVPDPPPEGLPASQIHAFPIPRADPFTIPRPLCSRFPESRSSRPSAL